MDRFIVVAQRVVDGIIENSVFTKQAGWCPVQSNVTALAMDNDNAVDVRDSAARNYLNRTYTFQLVRVA